MQNSSFLKIFFFDTGKENLDNFECSSMRRNLKASIELNGASYITNPIDERIKSVLFINYKDINKFTYFKDKEYKKITLAFFAENDTNAKILSKFKIIGNSNDTVFTIGESDKKILNQYDEIIVPSEEAKNYLLNHDITASIDVLYPVIKRTKYELEDKESKKLVYVYFRMNSSTKYFYTILDYTDEDAADKILELAKIYPQYKFIVIVHNLNKKSSKRVYKKFKKHPGNIIVTNIVPEDIYSSIVYNSLGYLLFNSSYGSTIELMEAYSVGKPVLALKSSSFKDILIDNETAYVYNNFVSLVNGFNEFISGNLPSIKEKQIEFSLKHSIMNLGQEFIKIYKKVVENEVEK